MRARLKAPFVELVDADLRWGITPDDAHCQIHRLNAHGPAISGFEV